MIIIKSIVEGHGEVEAFPILLRRIILQIHPNQPFKILKPYRYSQRQKISQIIEVCANECRTYDPAEHQTKIILLQDSEDTPPETIACTLFQEYRPHAGEIPFGIVLAYREYESWFIAAAPSLRNNRGLKSDLTWPENPEVRGAKEWLSNMRNDDSRYRETLDQAPLSEILDLQMAHERNASFRKLWREITNLANPHASD